MPLILPGGLRAAEANEKLSIAFVGMGGRMQGHVQHLVRAGHHVAAFCDVDLPRCDAARARFGERSAKANCYQDYRKMFDKEKGIDAVVISTPDHWHAPVIRQAFEANVHIFCEKPLTHTVGEAREIRELSRHSTVVTQTGNQGSASSNLRRSIELIRAGFIGQVTDIHIWHNERAWPMVADINVADPIPRGFNWDFWCGPSKMRPYKKGVYHPAKWRYWYEYGNGFVGDFCCHAFNMPVRALELDYAHKIEVTGEKMGFDCYPANSIIRYHFKAKANRGPVTMHVYDGGVYPDDDVLHDVLTTFGKRPRVDCLLIGDKGQLKAGLWNTECYVKLNDDEKFVGAGNHEAAKLIPQTLPRVKGHMEEWLDTIYGGPKNFADFDLGGHLTEIGLSGNVALRLRRAIEWDGEKMCVPGSPEADQFIHKQDRKKWL